MVGGFRFAEPAWLLAIAAVWVLGLLLYVAKERAWRQAILVLCAPRLREWNVRFSLPRERLRAICGLLALSLIFAALARPQAGLREVEITSPNSAVLFLLDVSRSMLATDVAPDRLTRAKLFAKDLLQTLDHAEVGLAVFAGEANLLVPPTRDHALVEEYLREASPGSVPLGGTNFENALHEAVAVLGALPHQDKSVIMLTDGEDLEGDIQRTVQMFKESGMRLYTAVFGTEEGSTIAVEQPGRGEILLRDPAGRVVISRARPRDMANLAETLGGTLLTEGSQPFPAKSSAEMATGSVRTVANEWFWLPAAGAFFCTLLHLVLSSRKIPRVRGPAKASQTRENQAPEPLEMP